MKWRRQGLGGRALIYACWIAWPRACISRVFTGRHELPGAKWVICPPLPLEGPHLLELGAQNSPPNPNTHPALVWTEWAKRAQKSGLT